MLEGSRRMGSITLGPPTGLIQTLKRDFAIPYFVETGTFRGDTAQWASTVFDKVFTVEASPELYEKAKTRLSGTRNVEVILGDSRQVLPEIVHSLDGPAVFWLDAHWSSDNTAGQGNECPILDEIRAVNASVHARFFFIDDARLFLSPPPPPYDCRQWPTIDELKAVIQKHRDALYVVVYQDVVVGVPALARGSVVTYCRESDLEQEHQAAKPSKCLSNHWLCRLSRFLRGAYSN